MLLEKGKSRAEQIIEVGMAGLSTDEAPAETSQVKKRGLKELGADVTCQEEEKKMKTTRRRYSPEYIDFILSWKTDWKIPDAQKDDEEMSEEIRSMRLHAISYFTELRARKRALQEFVKAQVAHRGYAEMPEEATEPRKIYDDEDGEELVYLGLGIYDG